MNESKQANEKERKKERKKKKLKNNWSASCHQRLHIFPYLVESISRLNMSVRTNSNYHMSGQFQWSQCNTLTKRSIEIVWKHSWTIKHFLLKECRRLAGIRIRVMWEFFANLFEGRRIYQRFLKTAWGFIPMLRFFLSSL